MGSGLSHKYDYTYGSDNEKRGTSKVREDILNYGKGGEISKLPRENGTSTRLDDGTIITYRVITSTANSPAVQINVRKVEANVKINGQKIHFIKDR